MALFPAENQGIFRWVQHEQPERPTLRRENILDRGRLYMGIFLTTLLILLVGLVTGVFSRLGSHIPKGPIETNPWLAAHSKAKV